MDIKDFILIVGGLLIAAVVMHGFWIAWRARREPLRLDLVPELVPSDRDEMDRFRGELPNGGARQAPSEQQTLELGTDLSGSAAPAPVLLEPSGASAAARRASDLELLGDPLTVDSAVAKRTPAPKARRRPKGPDLFTLPEGYGSEDEAADGGHPTRTEPRLPRVAEVTLPELNSLPSPETSSMTHPLVTEPKSRPELRARRAANQPHTERRSADYKPRRLNPSPATSAPQVEAEPDAGVTTDPALVEELLMIHLIAPRGQLFHGADLFAALRDQGLKFGAMSVFHRTDPMLKSVLYSVANAVEPGFFDLSDMDAMSTPGVTFFLQLPGPEEPAAALQDMLTAAQAMAHTLGGELRDELRNRLTRQTATHMKQRVSDFALKRMSRRAL